MQKCNWDLTRVGLCEHRKGKKYYWAENGIIKKLKHTGNYVIQVWTEEIENTMNTGWTCIHEKNVLEDKKSIKKYLNKKKLDMSNSNNKK